MSACHKYLSREDLWVSFAILFSRWIINQLRARPGCCQSKVHMCAHPRPCTETWSRSCLPFPRVGEGAVWGAELEEGKNPGLYLQDPRTLQNQGVKAGRQDVPVVGEVAYLMH